MRTRTDKEMLETIRKELREGEYYGLANNRIEWLLSYSGMLEIQLKKLHGENAKFEFA